MKRDPRTFTVTALADHLHASRATTLKLIAQAGISLEPTPLHYTDDGLSRDARGTLGQPRRRNWRALTGAEVDRVLELVRAKQGARVRR